MREDQEQPKKELKKNNFRQNYKDKVVLKQEIKLKQYKENSPSWIFYDRIFAVFLDIIMWIIIGVFIYIWWTTRGSVNVISCADISTDMCNQCFVYGEQIGQDFLNKSLGG